MAKLRALQDSGVDAYPVGQAPSHTVAQAIDAADGTAVTVAGPSAADPRLRRRVVRGAARLVRRNPTAA